MKKILSLLLLTCLISACSNPVNNNAKSSGNNHTEASWAYAFVKYDDISYELTKEEISEEQLGETIGEVKRNVVDMDTVDDYVETNFDSNELLVGTKLFAAIDNNDYIIYERFGKYFIAKQ